MLKFIDLDQARSKVGAGEAERPLSDLRLRDSSVDRATICWRGEIGWNAACASHAAPSRLLQKSARAVQARFWGWDSFRFSQPKEFSEHPTLHQFARPARHDGRSQRLGFDRCIRGTRPKWWLEDTTGRAVFAAEPVEVR